MLKLLLNIYSDFLNLLRTLSVLCYLRHCHSLFWSLEIVYDFKVEKKLIYTHMSRIQLSLDLILNTIFFGLMDGCLSIIIIFKFFEIGHVHLHSIARVSLTLRGRGRVPNMILCM